MDKLPISYENACIYKIVCKDVNITEKYIGSTTNLIKRHITHKNACNNEKSNNYNHYVYQFIRENGSFDNWDVVLVEKVIDCKDKENLHKRERYYIESLKAELNKKIPLRTQKEYDVDNREKKKEYNQYNKEKRKEYNQKNKERIKEYYQNNKEKLAVKMKDYYQYNKEKINTRMKEYYQNNKERISKQSKEWYEKNKLKPV
jgi:hypothetical protein